MEFNRLDPTAPGLHEPRCGRTDMDSREVWPLMSWPANTAWVTCFSRETRLTPCSKLCSCQGEVNANPHPIFRARKKKPLRTWALRGCNDYQ